MSERAGLRVVAVAALLAMAFAAAVMVQAIRSSQGSAATARRLVERIERESTARRDQSCLLFERQEERAIRSVQGSYTYLDHLSRAERRSSLTRAIVRNLPQTYADAKAAAAPSYCNAKGVGLPEPGPTLPALRDYSSLGR